MQTCPSCDGFIPGDFTACPHCESETPRGFNLKKRLKRATQIVLGASVTMTLSACYGAPPPMPDINCDDNQETEQPCEEESAEPKSESEAQSALSQRLALAPQHPSQRLNSAS